MLLMIRFSSTPEFGVRLPGEPTSPSSEVYAPLIPSTASPVNAPVVSNSTAYPAVAEAYREFVNAAPEASYKYTPSPFWLKLGNEPVNSSFATIVTEPGLSFHSAKKAFLFAATSSRTTIASPGAIVTDGKTDVPEMSLSSSHENPPMFTTVSP